MVTLGLLLVTALGTSCEKDTDCAGDWLCERGECVSPPPSPAPEVKRVPLKATGPCSEPLATDGQLKPECRAAPTLGTKQGTIDTRLDAPSVEERPSRVVGLIGIMYGALVIFGGDAVPLFAFSAAAGVRFRSGVGIVGVAHARIFVSPLALIQLYGIGPGIRFGNKSQLTLALTGTFASVTAPSTRATAAALFSVLAQIAVVVGDHFSLIAQPCMDFDSSGVIGSVTVGVGVTF